MKNLHIILSILILFTLSACKSDEVEILDWKPSELYSDQEILEAIDEVKDDFKHFKGCDLLTITYLGDDESLAYMDWAVRYEADEVLVLVSSFKTDSNPSETLEPNETYNNYKWICVKKDGKWHHVDHGY